MIRSWRTTALGVLTIIGTLTAGAVQLLNGHQPDLPTTIAGVTAGLGLIHAADNSELPPKPKV